jgi:hypothetical protein
MHPITRIFRISGGLSTGALIGNKFINFPIFILFLALIWTFIFLIYTLVISYFRTKHIYKLLKSDELDIRNSPLDKFSSLCVRVLFCLKVGFKFTAPFALVLGIMLITDQILEIANINPLFSPLIKGIFDSILPVNQSITDLQLIKRYITLMNLKIEELKKLEDFQN